PELRARLGAHLGHIRRLSKRQIRNAGGSLSERRLTSWPAVDLLAFRAGESMQGRPVARQEALMPINNRVADMQPEIAAWRQDIPAHPELMFDVHRTAALVADKLKAFGCDQVVTGIGRTGVVGVIRGKRGEGARTIGLRADMDALPITEATGLAYESRDVGK